MADPTSLSRLAPEVYAGFGASLRGKEIAAADLNNKQILSGPNWFYTLTGNAGGNGTTGSTYYKQDENHVYQMGRFGDKKTNWYCLDLVGKYNNTSGLKQFHALTFYFRNSRDASKGAIITSNLPESFTYKIGGNYSNPIQLGGGEFANAIAQSFTSNTKGLSFGVDTSLIWQSPQRMDIVFKIPVFDDSGSGTNVNYQEAIELFSEAILPQIGPDGLYRSVPGPNIIQALKYRATDESGGVHTKGSQTVADAVDRSQYRTVTVVDDAGNPVIDKKTGKPQTRIEPTMLNRLINGEGQLWDRICIQVGSLLLLDWCIIKDLKVTFPNTKAQVLHDFRDRSSVNSSLQKGTRYKAHLQPIQAELEVTVSTVMGMTRAVFRDMLYQNETVTDEVQTKDKAKDKGMPTSQETIEIINNSVKKPEMCFAEGYENSWKPIQIPEYNRSPVPEGFYNK